VYGTFHVLLDFRLPSKLTLERAIESAALVKVAAKDRDMKRVLTFLVLSLACCGVQQVVVVAHAQQQRPRVATGNAGRAETTKSGAAGGVWSPALTGERRPLYRLRTSDLLEIDFPLVPEFNQTVTIQPDGYIGLREAGQLYVEGKKLPELEDALRGAYAALLHDPEVTVVLKDYDRPYFVATGEVTKPGKYELRGDTTVTEALAIAGGFNGQAKKSQVVLFRRVSDELVETRLLDVKHMLKSTDLREDLHLRPGDLLYVPQNTISKLRRLVPTSSLSMYLNPTQF
jgi:polysaccharide export outer membrane protein